MALVSQTLKLEITPGGVPPILHVTEYDINMQITVELLQRGQAFAIPSGTTAKVEGTLAGHPFRADATPSGSTVTFELSESMTAFSGRAWTKIKLTKDNEPVSTCGFWLDCDRAGVEAGAVIRNSGFQDQVNAGVAAWMDQRQFAADMFYFRGWITSGSLASKTETGWYAINANSIGDITDVPDGVDNVTMLEVYNRGENNIIQRLYRYDGQMWSRFINQGVAESWFHDRNSLCFRGTITSGALSNYKEPGIYHVPYETRENITDMPAGIDNLASLINYPTGYGAVCQSVTSCWGKSFYRYIDSQGNAGEWRSPEFQKRGQMINGDDADDFIVPGTYRVYANAEVDHLPSAESGMLCVYNTSDGIWQTFISIDGRNYSRYVGRQWRSSHAPNIFHSERISDFVAAMNVKAEQIGMNRSVFTSPAGMGLTNKSTALDMLRLTVYAYSAYPKINDVWSQHNATITATNNGEDRTISVENTFDYSQFSGYEILGGKTGAWESPSYVGSLVCVARHTATGRVIAGAILGATTVVGRFKAMKELFDATVDILENGSTSQAVTYAPSAASCEIVSGSVEVTPVYTLDENTQRMPASTSKVMTMCVVCDCVRDFGKTYMLYSNDVMGGSGNNLVADDILTITDLMLDAMLPSSNSAATALASYVGGDGATIVNAYINMLKQCSNPIKTSELRIGNTLLTESTLQRLIGLLDEEANA